MFTTATYDVCLSHLVSHSLHPVRPILHPHIVVVCRQCWLQSKMDSTRKWLVLSSAMAVKDWVLKCSESSWPCIRSMFSMFTSELSFWQSVSAEVSGDAVTLQSLCRSDGLQAQMKPYTVSLSINCPLKYCLHIHLSALNAFRSFQCLRQVPTFR